MRESDLYRQIQQAASQQGARLWRNNVGSLPGPQGRPIRFGLANESKTVNQQIKSSDLIGITPVVVMPDDVGRVVGVFTSIEVKPPGWVWRGMERELAQLAWIELVRSMGGVGGFTNRPDGGIIWPI